MCGHIWEFAPRLTFYFFYILLIGANQFIETRAEQAKLFNDESSGYQVLVASDAIGMGLNL
jgi:hypothetical protein